MRGSADDIFRPAIGRNRIGGLGQQARQLGDIGGDAPGLRPVEASAKVTGASGAALAVDQCPRIQRIGTKTVPDRC
jgi:hypothetical protein